MKAEVVLFNKFKLFVIEKQQDVVVNEGECILNNLRQISKTWKPNKKA